MAMSRDEEISFLSVKHNILNFQKILPKAITHILDTDYLKDNLKTQDLF